MDISILDNTGNRFHTVLAESFQVAARLTDTHVLILDADIILIRGALAMIRDTIDHDPHYYRLEFKKICKFTTKQHGIHVYNTRRLRSEGIQYINDVDIELKPESSIVKRMYDDEREQVQLSGPIIGYHDFEQYYKHIYAKMIVRAMRDPDMLTHIRGLAQNNKLDHDFSVALEGFEFGLRAERNELVRRSYLGKYPEKVPIYDCTTAYGPYEHLRLPRNDNDKVPVRKDVPSTQR